MSSASDTIRIKDQSLDAALRPTLWDEYVGQGHVKANVQVVLTAAKKRGDMPEHLLFYGPPGVGKTTLAHLVAATLDIVLGKGPSARTVELALPPFTLVGATTKVAQLSSPLRSRFGGGVYQLDF